MALAFLAFVAAFLLMSSFGVLLFYRQKTLRRLSQVVSRATDASLLRSIAMPGSRIEKLVRPFQKVLPRSAAEVSTVQRRLICAGYREPSWVNVFYSAKVIIPGSLCILATI